ncbi:MAG: hypothetical protein PHF79_00585 [Candidatus Pacebacteria bacterium]|nr:hypothetical protein [Candidatus Paceibacterota bacterium]
MIIKAAIIGASPAIQEALSGEKFAARVLSAVVGQALGVENVLDRPAEYYVQHADTAPSPKHGSWGVEVRLSGASRQGRTAKQFHTALEVLHTIVKDVVSKAMYGTQRCQVFCVIMIDGDVETAPGSGIYSNNLESRAEWVEPQ